MVEIRILSTWKAVDTIEIPDEQLDEVVREVRAGRLPQVVADQIDASGAELTDWEVVRNG